MQTGRLSRLWRSTSLRKCKAITLPLTAACSHKELINPKLARHSSGTLMEVSSFPEVHLSLLFETYFQWHPSSSVLFFSQALSELYWFQKKPLFILELAFSMAACWLQKPPEDTGGLCAITITTLHFCPCHSNRSNCSLTPARISEELLSHRKALYFRWPATS